jgi:hypothetical protein
VITQEISDVIDDLPRFTPIHPSSRLAILSKSFATGKTVAEVEQEVAEWQRAQKRQRWIDDIGRRCGLLTVRR